MKVSGFAFGFWCSEFVPLPFSDCEDWNLD